MRGALMGRVVRALEFRGWRLGGGNTEGADAYLLLKVAAFGLAK